MTTSLFHVCQGSCLCATGMHQENRAKVLYCYGEVVLQRTGVVHGDPDREKTAFPDETTLQVGHMAVLVAFFLTVVVVLMLIKHTVSSIHRRIEVISKSNMKLQSTAKGGLLLQRNGSATSMASLSKPPEQFRDSTDGKQTRPPSDLHEEEKFI